MFGSCALQAEFCGLIQMKFLQKAFSFAGEVSLKACQAKTNF